MTFGGQKSLKEHKLRAEVRKKEEILHFDDENKGLYDRPRRRRGRHGGIS